MTTVQEQYQELCKLDPRIDDRIFIKSLNIVDRNKKEVISYLHGTSEPSPEFLKSWNNTIYPGYKNKLDNYPKISELYVLIDDIIKDKGELYRKLLKQASGLDDILDRVSCWCCANKNKKELENMRIYLPQYYLKYIDLLKKIKENNKKGIVVDIAREQFLKMF